MVTSGFQDPVSWPFLPLPQLGQLTYPTLDRSVRDAIRVILTTRPGDQNLIVQNLQTYEPRITVDRVDVDPVANAPSQVHVQIYYRLLRTNAAQQVGLTMTVS